MIDRWSVAIQPSRRISRSARETVSRVAPVQLASSSWVSANSISVPRADARAVIGGQLEQALGDHPDAVLSGEVDAVAVGLGQPPHEHPDQHQRHVGVAGQERLELVGREVPDLDVVDGDRASRCGAGRASAAISPISSPRPRIASTTSRLSAP